jgi:hypothetical protein
MTNSQRLRLPNRRAAETFELELGGLRYTATASRYADGSIGELFLTNHKSNSQADTIARDSATVFSFAVQHGADPHAIRLALATPKAAPLVRSGPRSLSCLEIIMSAPQPPRPTYVLRLQSPHGDDARRLRWALKTMLPPFGLRCRSLERAPPNPSSPSDNSKREFHDN